MALRYVKGNNSSLIVKDPIYGKICVPYPFSRIIMSKEMKRLGDISQNGFSQCEFKGLKNNDRLSHSIGAFHVMSLILKKLEKVLDHYNISISEDDKQIALCSMLLHDIGHGPFSHSLEIITNYSHEQRTIDILLGKTQINEFLTSFFGEEKVKKIAGFIAEINSQETMANDSFTKLLKNLISHQLDADRLDYLMRDAYHAEVKSLIDLDKIINNFNVVINKNQEYELVINKAALSNIENVLIQRYQMYRDVYLSPISVLGDELFKKLLERYMDNKALHSLPVSKSFKLLATDPKITDLDDFIGMSDSDFASSFYVLMKNDIDYAMAYLSNFDNLRNFILVENDITEEKIKAALREIFGNVNLDNLLSIISVKTKSKLYKKEQSLNIQNGNKISDLTECTNLIRPQEILENTYVFFNPRLLMLELGMAKEEFKKYESELAKMLEDLNKKPEEFELKYIVDEQESNEEMLKRIIEAFKENGFSVISYKDKVNNDEYFDTNNLDLYNKKGSLRIREATQEGKTKYKGTYKTPLDGAEVYSSRSETEEPLPDSSFDSLREEMIGRGVSLDFDKIVNSPVLNSKTKRTDTTLEKNGIRVCLSLDNSVYTNHFLDDMMATDRMIEIETMGEVTDRVILNEIHDFIKKSMPRLTINKQSKYERGIEKTIGAYIAKTRESKIDLSQTEGIKILSQRMKANN